MVDLNLSPFREIEVVVLLIFTVDYVSRFYLSPSKSLFFKSNLFDLIAIIPFHSTFAVFRITRLFRVSRLSRLSRLTRLTRLTRVIGVIGKVRKKVKLFLHTNGFIYIIYLSGVLLLGGAAVYSITEKVTFVDSLWWAFVTSTTVGYGDISPTTAVGRLVAMVLMITGIGMFGALTSTITSFFIGEENEKKSDQDEKIQELNAKIDKLIEIIDRKELNE